MSAGLLLSNGTMHRTALHWRSLTTLDLPAVEAIAGSVHPSFPEDIAVLAERQRLYPDGARFLELNGQPAGYVLSHPWTLGDLPALNSRLGHIPVGADTYYIHDLALLPVARGTGAATQIVGALIEHGKKRLFASVSLVAVNGSLPFWRKHGFEEIESAGLTSKLASYEPTARLMVRALA
ncbi:MAG TPA: GNAT family N-acetyltransferase [Devosia sp.]|nr:GNAT family N-acetyltransferase [Devosia sp.]